MDLTSILEYQKVDIRLRKALDEIERHELNKLLAKAKQGFNAAKEQVEKSEGDASIVINFFKKAHELYGALYTKVEQLIKQTETIDENDEKERRAVLKELEDVRGRISTLEKELQTKKADSDKAISDYLKAQESGKRMKEAFQSTKSKLEEFRKSKEPELLELKKALESMEPSINKELFAKYKELTAERRYPAVVPATTADGGKNYNCGGCGLGLSQKIKDELIDKEICRCDNCRRIVYKQK